MINDQERDENIAENIKIKIIVLHVLGLNIIKRYMTHIYDEIIKKNLLQVI